MITGNIAFANVLDTGGVVSVDILGYFSTTEFLIEGANRFQAAAGNWAAVDPKYTEVLIMLDTTLPVTLIH